MASTQNLWSIDGRYFNVFIPEGGIKRKFNVADTDAATRSLSGKMIRDVIGTFYNYTIEINTNYLSPDEYDAFYELISSPADSHVMRLPYGKSGSIQIEAYITTGEDTLVIVRNGQNKWSNLSVNIIAMEPLRYPD